MSSASRVMFHKWYHIVMLSAILHINKKEAKKIKRLVSKFVLAISFILLFFTISLLIYSSLFFGKIYPNISVAGIKIGGLTPQNATFLLSQRVQSPDRLNLLSDDATLIIETKDLGLTYDYSGSAERAYSLARSGNIFFDLETRIDLILHPKNIGLSTSVDEEKIGKILSVFSGQLSIEPKAAGIKIVSGAVQVERGQPGKEVDQKLLRALIGEHLSNLNRDNINIPVNIIDNSLTDQEVVVAKERGEKLVGKSLAINFETYSLNLSDSKLAAFLEPRGGLSNANITALVVKISGEINRDPQNPKFVFDGGRVTEFQPALDGIRLDTDSFKNKFSETFNSIQNGDQKTYSFEIPATRTPPEVSTDQVNNLGIKELIGRGTSTYYHSIPSRIHNIVLAAGRINGTLVKPGASFSFNDTLGDVSQFTGYQQAYIISDGKTILGDGGGVCQVSTTLFRAILKAGLPITERQAHAYRVGYYEQNSPPGLDATVYGPSPDLKFTNDTSDYILIEAKANTKNSSLVFELYGTSDGRVSTTSKPVISDTVAPPEDLYQDDPTLPAGTIKQIDFKAWGAKVVFNYSVVRNGEQIYKKTFISNYRPWQAVYLRGTGAAI